MGNVLFAQIVYLLLSCWWEPVCSKGEPEVILFYGKNFISFEVWAVFIFFFIWLLLYFSRGESMESFEAVWRPIKLNLSLFSTEESSPLDLLLRRTSKSSPPSSCSSNEANHNGFLGVLQQSLPLDSVIQLKFIFRFGNTRLNFSFFKLFM